MQRYFIDAARFAAHRVTIGGNDAHHIVRVMRMTPGDQFIVSDGESREAVAEIAELAPGEVIAEIVELREMTSEPLWHIVIAQGLPKGDKMETVIQKGTEIGAAGFIPFQSERVVVQYDDKKEGKRLERWQRIAKEAAEQAHRSKIPPVRPVMSWPALLAEAGGYDLALLCYEKQSETPSHGLRELIALDTDAQQMRKVLLIVGPEGGFSEREVAEAEACGIRIAGLGRRILRTETAALVGLTCLMYESGEMGGI
ncbi:16S rRNA (uracil(1498)-N(3))-methyltransferase [Paenibacillus sp. 1P07SE]|uniref:16S rRNA (uracil(1498)-N(3))-methyltransferase n=1 Tax=Paenibacillus sp. 1P07SE TaxID=3132209 RepID=UPI0039A6B207